MPLIVQEHLECDLCGLRHAVVDEALGDIVDEDGRDADDTRLPLGWVSVTIMMKETNPNIAVAETERIEQVDQMVQMALSSAPETPTPEQVNAVRAQIEATVEEADLPEVVLRTVDAVVCDRCRYQLGDLGIAEGNPAFDRDALQGEAGTQDDDEG